MLHEAPRAPSLGAEPDIPAQPRRSRGCSRKREKKGRHRATIQADLAAVVERLADDLPLAAAYVDHALAGPWRDHRDLHVKPDLVLIDRRVDPAKVKGPEPPERPRLYLVRLGSHSELGF